MLNPILYKGKVYEVVGVHQDQYSRLYLELLEPEYLKFFRHEYGVMTIAISIDDIEDLTPEQIAMYKILFDKGDKNE